MEIEFGIVFDCGDFSCDGALLFAGTYLDPRANYRAYIVSGDTPRRRRRGRERRRTQ
ncbi:MAG: hypothetical protein AAF184_17410 [Pseudomonadota bacterium]